MHEPQSRLTAIPDEELVAEVAPEKPVSAMSEEELAATRDAIAERLLGLLSQEDRLELGAKLNDALAEIKRRAEIAEMSARYQS